MVVLMDFEYRSFWCISFMDALTGILECTLCKLKRVFMAMFMAFDNKDYWSVHYANLNGFSW